MVILTLVYLLTICISQFLFLQRHPKLEFTSQRTV